MRVLKALGASLLLIALIVGVPALLVAWGSPLALLDVDWSTVLLRPDTGVVVVGVLSVLGWLAWLVLSAATVLEVVSQISRRRWRLRLPGVSWLQPMVGGLVAMAMTPLASTYADEPPPTAVAHAPIAVVADHPAENHPTVSAPAVRNYAVLPGDELWGVAERELGSGAQWRAIVACNPGMTADSPLVPGGTIRLPSVSPVPASAGPEDALQITVRKITVRRGDTLWDLAREHLGDPERWPEIFAANRDVIADADEIDIGWELTVPQPLGEPEVQPVGSPDPDPSPVAVQPVGSPDPDPGPVAVQPVESAKPMEPVAPAAPDEPAASNTAPPPRASVPSHSTNATVHPESPDARAPRADADSVLEILGPVGGVLAASLVAGIAARRRIQLLHRGIGRRIPTLSPHLQRFFSALVHRSPESTDERPALQSTSVVVGWNEGGDVHVDVEREGCTLLVGSDEDTAGMAATVLTSLLSAEWSAGVEVVAVQPQDDWASALEDPRLATETVLDDAFGHLQRVCARRRLQLGPESLAEVRADQNRAEVWAPLVFVFCTPLHLGHLDRIHDCLSLGRVGVSVVATVATAPPGSGSATPLVIESGNRAHLENTGVVFQPQLLTQPARHAVMSLFVAALDEEDEPAPWWQDGASLPHPTVTVLPQKAEEPLKDDEMPTWSPPIDQPSLLLLGPVELLHARGTPPLRAVGQCMEYCAWLLLHPGATPMAMVRDLLVAEGTRRSNMSRLRTWLGDDPQGMPHLPDAYSGHIALAPTVTSDWENFQSLLAGGVNLSSTPLLREALSLVRGQPLEDVSFQWPWVAGWLGDMISMITDAATVLADRCLTDADPVGALWAIDQGLRATGDDETLTVRRIQALAAAGNRPEVEATVTRLTRAARAENRDLTPDSIRRIQQALHTGMSPAVSLRHHPNISVHDSEGRPVR